jgi:hypothetical protein
MNFKDESGQSLLACNSLGWITLEERRAQMKARLIYKSINKLALQRLSNFFKIEVQLMYDYDLRGSSTRLNLPSQAGNRISKKSFSYNGAHVWNQIPEDNNFGIL